MFIGEYQHILDAKKRVAVPAKFRDDFKSGVVVTRGLDKSLFIYTKEKWQEIATKLSSMPIGESTTRSFVRLMLSGASEVSLDSQGRILIPEYLKDYAGLDKQLILAGVFDRVEIWDEGEWNNYKREAERNQDKIAEELGKLGMY